MGLTKTRSHSFFTYSPVFYQMQNGRSEGMKGEDKSVLKDLVIEKNIVADF